MHRCPKPNSNNRGTFVFGNKVNTKISPRLNIVWTENILLFLVRRALCSAFQLQNVPVCSVTPSFFSPVIVCVLAQCVVFAMLEPC